jgi:hypothetical protein
LHILEWNSRTHHSHSRELALTLQDGPIFGVGIWSHRQNLGLRARPADRLWPLLRHNNKPQSHAEKKKKKSPRFHTNYLCRLIFGPPARSIRPPFAKIHRELFPALAISLQPANTNDTTINSKPIINQTRWPRKLLPSPVCETYYQQFVFARTVKILVCTLHMLTIL